MPKLSVFNSISLDGFFADANNDMRWAHRGNDDAEWNAFVSGNAAGGGVLMFGRITYEMMAGYWPTPLAMKNDPAVAERMNGMKKIVFSRTLENASWNNTRLIKGDLVSEVKKLKQEPGDNITILGSGQITSQLAAAGLIDHFQFVVVPVILGKGRTMFEGVSAKLNLKRINSRSFGNGNVLLSYAPA